MADPFSNWGSTGSSGTNWGGGAPTYGTSHYGALPTPKASSGGGGSWFSPIVHAIESSPVGQFVGLEHNIAQNLWRSPSKTGIGITQLPHSLYAGPWALIKLAEAQAKEESKHGIKGVLGGPLTYESLHTLLHDPHTLAGGAAVPLVQQYNNKYEVGNIIKDTAFGNWGQLGHDVRLAGHHEEQDPLGTLLDLTVAGKAAGIAHLHGIEAAAEAGKAPSAFGRLALSPRELVLRDFKDAEGVPVRLDYQASTSYGRVLQHQMDAFRFGRMNAEGVRVGGLPGQVTLLGHQIANVPFGKASAFAREDRRSRDLLHAQNRQLVKVVQDHFKGIPDDQARAIVDVIAEQTREPHVQDPIQNLIDYRERQISSHESAIAEAKAAGEKATVRDDITTVNSLKSKVASLKALDKKAIYADNPELRAAVDAVRGLGETVTERAIREGHLDPEQVEMRALGPQKIMSGGGYRSKTVTGGEVVPDTVKIAEQARARRAMIEGGTEVAKARKSMLDSWNSVVHHTQTRTLKNLYEEYQARIKNLRKAPRREPGHLPEPPPAGAPEVLPPITEPEGPITFLVKLPSNFYREAESKGLDVGVVTSERKALSKRPGQVTVRLNDEQFRVLQREAKTSGKPEYRAARAPLEAQRDAAYEAAAKVQRKLRWKKDPTTGGYYVEGTTYHIQQDPQTRGYLGFHGDELLSPTVRRELKFAKEDVEKDVQQRRVEQLRTEREAANPAGDEFRAAVGEPVTGRQLGEEPQHLTNWGETPDPQVTKLRGEIEHLRARLADTETRLGGAAARRADKLRGSLKSKELRLEAMTKKQGVYAEPPPEPIAFATPRSTPEYAQKQIDKLEAERKIVRRKTAGHYSATVRGGAFSRLEDIDKLIEGYKRDLEAAPPIEFATPGKGEPPVTTTGAASTSRTVKGKTFKQYAEEVYPKRTEMGGAVGRALLKHEVLVDDFLKKQKAYQALRDEWQGRRPPLTESGKGRQHHTISTPRTVESAGLKGGRSYEDLQAANQAAVDAYAAGDVTGHNPLAQYGMPFRAPHLPSVSDPALARIYTRAKAVLTKQSANEAWQTNKYVLWQRGMIANNPEVFTIDFLRQARWFATEDHFWKWVVPQSGALDPTLAHSGGKEADEFYVKTKPSATVPRDAQQATQFFHDLSAQADDALAREQHSYVTPDLLDAMKMKPGEEDAAAWVARMNDQGIRRLSGDVARTWQIDTRPSSLLRRIVLRNGVNQIWRFFLLGIKPAWSVANAMTNETLVAFRYLFTKGGGTAFYNSMVDTFGAAKAAEIVKARLGDTHGVGLINLRNLMQSDPRLADLFAGSFGKQLDRQLQHVGSMADEWNRSVASKTARLLLPYTRDWGPVRLLRGFANANYRFNIHAENAARAAAVQAEITRVTGKMVKTVEDLQDAMKSMRSEDFDKVRSGVLDALGDYSNLGSFEREWIVTFAPFYPWFKTIMGITAKWVTRHPERLWALGVMAHTFQQTQNQDYMLGVPLPYFAADSIPAGKPTAGGEQRIVTDRAFNPLVTPIDIINTAKSLTGDPNAQPSDLGLALLGPAAQFGYVAMTGRDPFYGGDYSGPLAGQPALVRGFGSLLQTPQYRTIQQFGGIPGLVPAYKSKVYNTPAGPSGIPGISEADWLAIEQYWGVPVRYANLENLKTRALTEQGQPVSTTKPPAMPAYNPAPQTSGSFSNWGGG